MPLRLDVGDKVRLTSVRYGVRTGFITVVSPNGQAFRVALSGKLPASMREREVLATRQQLALVR
jgi:hypothetical protein